MLKMRFFLFFFLIYFPQQFFISEAQSSIIDNEFAEFEVADDDKFSETISPQAEKDKKQPEVEPNRAADDEKAVKKERSPNKIEQEFEAFDEEEFEGFEKESEPEEQKDKGGSLDTGEENKPMEIKPLTFADIPSHFRSNWSSYQVEALALLVIFIYILNYVYGKSINYSIAYNWFTENRPKLETEFALVGDDGTSQEPELEGGILIRETDNSYLVWSTGRIGCRGMLTSIKLSKRQDVLGLAISIFRPNFDRVVHKINLDRNEVDSYVLIFGQRKSVHRTAKEMNDLSIYVAERKMDKISLPQSFTIFAEIAETIPALIDSTTTQFIKKCEKYIEYIYISDQFSGPRQQDEQQTKLPETAPTLIFSYFLLGDEELSGIHELLLNFTFFMLEKVRRYRLSREGKMKADKKRQSVEENFLKVTHQQRQEAAMTRREEKTRERKQRVMEEEDPEKQRRLERIEHKRDAKLKQPKLKAFKIK